MSWYLDNTKLNHADLSGSVPETGICGDDSGAPYYGYPASFWYLDTETNKLNLALIPTFTGGAFYGASKLKETSLPTTLTSIGRYSFAGTALTSVTIPNNQCTYYATSFPANCVVTGGRLIE